jgi:hypothetical protein
MSFNLFAGIYFIVLAAVFLFSGDLCLTATFGLLGYIILKIYLAETNVTSRSDEEIINRLGNNERDDR